MCNNSNLELFLDLGLIPLVDRFLSFDELSKEEESFPLNVYFCKNCGLSQLGYLVPPEKLFNENYAYESITTKGRRENHKQLADYVCKEFDIDKNSLVVDIGSNVGVLLTYFKENGMRIIGVDASSNVVNSANSNNIKTILGFFNDDIVDKIISEEGNAKVITGTNLFAHIQNYDLFIVALKKLLTKDGIFVFQVPHILQLLKNIEYDTIYHEHISYFGLKPLIQFFKNHDMELFDVIETEIDGGSIRCFVSRKGQKPISSNIEKILKIEEEEGVYYIERLKKFANDVQNQKKQLLDLLTTLKQKGKNIVGVGAPAKGITLLNYCKIDTNILDYITEKSTLKIGKFTPGMHIPVKPDTTLIDKKPDFALILAWNFAEEIMKNLEDYTAKGGKFIIPIPIPKII